MNFDLDSIDLSSFDESSLQNDFSEGWKPITVVAFGEPTASQSGGVNIRMYYSGLGKKEQFYNLHFNAEKPQSYAINVEIIATILSNSLKITKRDVMAKFKAKEITITDALKQCLNLQVMAYFGKRKDNDFLEIKKFFAYGEQALVNKKPATINNEDVPF